MLSSSPMMLKTAPSGWRLPFLHMSWGRRGDAETDSAPKLQVQGCGAGAQLPDGVPGETLSVSFVRHVPLGLHNTHTHTQEQKDLNYHVKKCICVVFQ